MTGSEIGTLYNSGSGDTTPSTTNLIAHYDFEQTGSTLENQLFNTATALSDKSTNSVPINYGLTNNSPTLTVGETVMTSNQFNYHAVDIP